MRQILVMVSRAAVVIQEHPPRPDLCACLDGLVGGW
jgi:hypothetical protein